jgi:Lrp/AsnC family transcriptional regulator for asnA, asnC and gidA
MEEIDVKDRKILYYLSLDSRQSLTKLGKKVGLSRELVKYRIKRLQEKGIIKNFITITQASALGVFFIRFYYNFQNTTPEIKKEIINYFINHEKTLITKQVEARYDLEVQYYFKNGQEFHYYNREFKMRYGDYISNEFISTQFSSMGFDYLFLLGKEKIQNRQILNFPGDIRVVKLDELDIKLLRLINDNARMPTTEIAKKLDTTPFIIKNKIKRLIKEIVIKGFTLDIDFTKLGYYFFHVDIRLKRYDGLNEVIEYVKKNPYLYHIENNAGISDISLQFYLKDSNQLHDILEDISNKIPNTIKSYKYHRITKEHPRKFITI